MLQYIVLFLIYTGARKREVLDAKWQDIDWDKKSWRIPKTKSGKVRHIPLSKAALDVITSLKSLLLGGEWGVENTPQNFSEVSERFIFMNTRTGKAYNSFFFTAGMPLAFEPACPICACMICGTALPLFWSMQAAVSMKSKNCWVMQTFGPPAGMLI